MSSQPPSAEKVILDIDKTVGGLVVPFELTPCSLHPTPTPMAEISMITTPQHPSTNVWQFADEGRFPLQYRNESHVAATLADLCACADIQTNTLYTQRSLMATFKALMDNIKKFPPEVQDKLNKEQLRVLKRDLMKLKQFYEFVQHFKATMLKIFDELIALDPKQYMVSDPLMFELIRALDKLVIMNEIKNRKESPNNEISYYQRVQNSANKVNQSGHAPASACFDDDDIPGGVMDSMKRFFGTPNSIVTEFKKELNQKPGSYLPVVSICNEAVNFYRQEVYHTAQEKYMLIRVMGIGMYFIDGSFKVSDKDKQRLYLGQFTDFGKDKKEFDVFKKGGLELEGMREIMTKIPRLPVMFEIAIQTMKFVKMCSKYSENSSQWPDEPARITEEPARDTADMFEEDTRTITARFTSEVRRRASETESIVADLPASEDHQEKSGGQRTTTQKTKKMKSEETLARDSFAILKETEDALVLLRKMNEFLLEFLAFKFSCPAKPEQIKRAIAEEESASKKNGVPFTAPKLESISEFEQCIRYNLTQAERSALVVLVGSIRHLSNTLLRNADQIQPFISRAVFLEVQELVQLTLRKPIMKAVKGKKSAFAQRLLGIREVAADWLKKEAVPNDPVLSGKDDKGYKPEMIKMKAVQPQQTQMFVLRSLISSIGSPRSPSLVGQGFFGGHDIEKEDVDVLAKWVTRSFLYPFTLSIADTVRGMTDLGSLWYREDFIERGKRSGIIQFPIESSLPWILTMHVYQNRTFEMDNVLGFFDLYSDAANVALRQLKSRHLFDEIEGEAHLGIQQLFSLVPTSLFSYLKKQSALEYLDSSFRAMMDAAQNSSEKRRRGGGLSSSSASSSAVIPSAGGTLSVPTGRRGKGRGVSRFAPVKIEIEALFRLHHITLVGHPMDFGAIMSSTVENKLQDNVRAALSLLVTPHTIVFGDLLLSSLLSMHHKLSAIIPMDNSWKDRMDAEMGRSSVASLYASFPLQVVDSVMNEIAQKMRFNMDTMVFVNPDVAFTLEKAEYGVKKAVTVLGPDILFTHATNKIAISICAASSQYFGATPHLSCLLKWMSVEDPFTIVKTLCDYFGSALNDIVTLGRRLSLCLEFAGRNTPYFDLDGEATRRFYKPRRENLLKKVGTLKKFAQAVTQIGNILAFVMLMDSALASNDMVNFNYGSAAAAYGMRASFYTATQLPPHTVTTAPTPRTAADRACYENGSNPLTANPSSTPAPPPASVAPLNPLELVVNSLDPQAANEQTLPPLPTLAPAALNAAYIHTRPLFQYAVQRLFGFVREMEMMLREGMMGGSLNEEGETDVEKGKKEGCLTLLSPHSKETFKYPAATSMADLGNAAGNEDGDVTGTLASAINEKPVPHAKMIYEVFCALLDLTMASVGTKEKFSQIPKSSATSSIPVVSAPQVTVESLNLWEMFGDGFLIGMQALIHLTGQQLPFDTTTPLNIVDTLMIQGNMPSSYTPADDYFLPSMREDMAAYRLWAQRLSLVLERINGLLNSSVPVHPFTKIPLIPKDLMVEGMGVDIGYAKMLKRDMLKKMVPHHGEALGMVNKTTTPKQGEVTTAMSIMIQEAKSDSKNSASASASSSASSSSSPSPVSSEESQEQPQSPSSSHSGKTDSSDDSVPPPPPLHDDSVPPPPADDGVPPPPPVDDGVPPPPPVSSDLSASQSTSSIPAPPPLSSIPVAPPFSSIPAAPPLPTVPAAPPLSTIPVAPPLPAPTAADSTSSSSGVPPPPSSTPPSDDSAAPAKEEEEEEAAQNDSVPPPPPVSGGSAETDVPEEKEEAAASSVEQRESQQPTSDELLKTPPLDNEEVPVLPDEEAPELPEEEAPALPDDLEEPPPLPDEEAPPPPDLPPF
ncbi:putative p53 inducible protein [Monocercomonoides exilis]|uniref:putative p53 inducible protein n=1 Tax=Monocercomonoides exilis TaxID=2049356 RepID=UPI00355A5248|nr:putative p53 inducible protein [Monocercomonoides exilis]|eukprot:MONOS_2278.1-p1 / transcript=MONOS_2278.1 / gene=MONOS_2278 / organism=Monocercomonoides_exilis_PA203 / gene_product=p53 inducible protein / transcript_product=p53 inducible protein / location=Mono_scaffold00046:56693-62793(-) / protein_length=1858 / sequence_SO=supercontig / SO=protein_coding / is_pseudo=false